jgi:glycosyltransferase involved in cell wall biosynthesis
VNVLWLCSEPVAQGALGITGRLEAVRYLIRHGHQVTMVCGGHGTENPFEDVPTRFIRTRYIPFLAWLYQWPAVLRVLPRIEPRPDLVVSDTTMLPPLMRWVTKRRGQGLPAPRTVLDVRTPPVEAGRLRTRAQRARFALTLRLYLRQVDAVTAISEGVRNWVSKLGGVPAESIAVWRSGCSWCDVDAPQSAWPRELSRQLRERFVLLYHGSLSAGRGLFEAVEAVELVRREIPSVCLVLLGAGSAAGHLKALIHRRDLQDHVVVVDPVPQGRVPEFLGVANAGVVPLPKRWEWEISSPVKLAEYVCWGLPVVLTDIQAHRIVPLDAPFAFWSRSSRPGDLAAAMLRAAQSRPKLRELGEEARAWGRDRLGWSDQLKILEDVLCDAVESGRPQEAARTTEPRSARTS